MTRMVFLSESSPTVTVLWVRVFRRRTLVEAQLGLAHMITYTKTCSLGSYTYTQSAIFSLCLDPANKLLYRHWTRSALQTLIKPYARKCLLSEPAAGEFVSHSQTLASL